jgi:hypothetical protein
MCHGVMDGGFIMPALGVRVWGDLGIWSGGGREG